MNAQSSNALIKDLEFVVLDLETSGLNSQKDQIIEIACYKFNTKGEIIDKYVTLIQLLDHICLTPQIIDITKIDNQMLAQEGLDYQQALDGLLAFCQDSIIIGQNVLFDLKFIIEYALHQKIIFTNPYLDLIPITKFINSNLANYKLQTLAQYYQVTSDVHSFHRAEYDIYITMQCFLQALHILEKHNIKDIKSLFSISKYQLLSEKQAQYLQHLTNVYNYQAKNLNYLTKTNASYIINHIIENN